MAYLGKTPSQAVRNRYYFTATGGETSLSGTDDNSNTLTFTDGNYVDVTLNGVTLVAGTDYNTTTANTIGGLTALTASDVVEVVVYDTFSVFSGNVNGDFTVGGSITTDGLTTTGDINFGDNDKAQFGAGSDLQIYHDGSDSYIKDNGTGNLSLLGTNVVINNSANSQNMFVGNDGGEVSLFHAGNQKLATTSTGVDVTGNVDLEGGTGGVAVLRFKAEEIHGTVEGINIGVNYGGLAFKTNNNGTTAERMRIDNAGNVGIGTSSPDALLEIKSSSPEFRVTDGGGDYSQFRYNGGQLTISSDEGGSVSGFTVFKTNASERMRIDSSGKVGIGTSSPASLLSVQGDGLSLRLDGTGNTSRGILLRSTGTAEGQIQTDGNMHFIQEDAGRVMKFSTSNTERMRIDGSGDIGIGTSSPVSELHLAKQSGTGDVRMTIDTGSGSASGEDAQIYSYRGNAALAFGTNNTERMRITSNGELLVGRTSTINGNTNTTSGTQIGSNGLIQAAVSGDTAIALQRLSTDGDIIQFRKDNTAVGSIQTISGAGIAVGTNDTALRYDAGSDVIVPFNISTGNNRDNAIDFGASSARFDDIFATNSTIQTSDENEKQQIASLTSAEITAAKAISKLFKTFKWNSSVTENGANARTHTGVIAQQVETAMTDAGLDAGDYAFYISDTWYVDADGNEVDADAVGAISKTRKGIRYPELLSFIGAATEQRLADIETRLTALENA